MLGYIVVFAYNLVIVFTRDFIQVKHGGFQIDLRYVGSVRD